MKCVSIIIPVYNDEKFIEECLNSVFLQTYANLEVIIVDDGSTDSTLEKVQQYRNKIKIIKQSNGGPSKARNAGIKVATGEYVCFVDGDDYLEPNLLQDLVSHLEGNKADLTISGFKMVCDHEIINKVNFTNEKLISRKQIFDYVFPYFRTYKLNAPYSRLYKTEIIRNNNIKFNESISLGEDTIFNLEYMSVIDKCVFFEGMGYCYRQGNNFLTKKFSGDFLSNKKKRYDIIKMILTTQGVNIKFLNGQLMVICFSYFMELVSLKEKHKISRINEIEKVIKLPDVQEALHNYKGNFLVHVLGMILRLNNPKIIYMMASLLLKAKRIKKFY